MRLHVIPSPFYAANGLVLVPSGAGTALVVDPSAGIQHLIREVLELEGVSGPNFSDVDLQVRRGEIVGMGTHDELMQFCKVYREIATSQLSATELA